MLKKITVLTLCMMLLLSSAASAAFIKPQYDGAETFSGNIAPVKVLGLFGFIDRNGEMVTEPKYTAVDKLNDGYYKVRYEGKWGAVDPQGREVIPCAYDECSAVISNGVWVVSKDNKWGAVSTQGTVAVPIAYDYMGDFTGALAPVSNGGYWNTTENSNYRIYYGSNYGYVDLSGNIKIQMQYSFAAPFSNGRARVKDSDGKMFFIDETGVSCSGKYTEAKDFCEGVAAVLIGNAWGYIDVNGVVVIEPAYLDAESFNEGLATVGNIVGEEYLEGVITLDGAMAVPYKYDKIYPFYDGMAIVENNGMYGFINSSGNEIVAPELYKKPGNFSEGVALLRDAGSDKYINARGETVLDLGRLHGESAVSCGIALVSDDNGKFGFVKVKPGEGVRVIVNGKTVKTDSPAVIINDRTMVPLRVISESLGAEVRWDGSTRTVYISSDGNEIEMSIGNSIMKKNSEQITLDSHPVIINDRTMVPVRAIAQSLGANVDWDGESASALISK